MANRPLVSIITPSYNRKDFIRLCIDSVQAQSYGNIEHIVIDGASTDGTPELLDELSKKYTNLKYVSEPDDGMYHAINKGLELATGDIVAYLNTDDLYFPWTVERAVEKLVNGSDVVYGDLCIIKHHASDYVSFLQFYPKFDLNYFCHYSTIAQPTVFLKRAVYKNVGSFGNGFSLLADCDYWLRCAEAGFKLEKMDEVMAIQIDHSQTLREVFQERVRNEFLLLWQTHGGGRSVPSRFKKEKTQSIVSRFGKMSFFSTVLLGFPKKDGWRYFRDMLASTHCRASLSDVVRAVLPGFIQAKNP